MFLMVEVFTEALEIEASVCHVHLNLLLSIIDEVVVASSLTLELVSMSQVKDFGTELTHTERLIL